jgi:hypothetical protein
MGDNYDMQERRVKTPYPTPQSPVRDGSEVQVKESNERWSEVTLEDGTILRLKPNVLEAIRVDGEYDQEGNPAYAVKTALMITIISTPAHLRKGAQAYKA